MKTASDVLCDKLYVTIIHSQRHKKRFLIVIHLNGLHCTVFHSFSEVVHSFFCRMFCWQHSKKTWVEQQQHILAYLKLLAKCRTGNNSFTGTAFRLTFTSAFISYEFLCNMLPSYEWIPQCILENFLLFESNVNNMVWRASSIFTENSNYVIGVILVFSASHSTRFRFMKFGLACQHKWTQLFQ